MKTGPYTSGAVPSNFDGGNMTSTDAVLKADAQYFVKFVQGYADNGITIEAVAPQNEPSYNQNYPSCDWTPAIFTKFVGQYLGPAITAAGLNTKIMLGTMSSSSDDSKIVTAVMGDATAKSYIKMLGYQWTMVSQVSAAKSYNLPIWQTEHQCGNNPFGGNPGGAGNDQKSAPNDQAYGVESWGRIRDWIKNGVNSYSAWNMVLDTVGWGIDTNRKWSQNALLAIDTSTNTLIPTPAYYVFRHFSQFVDPGAKVVSATGGDALAFKNPSGSIVVVMYNSGAANANYTVSVGGKLVKFAMPAAGWATIVQ
jgi:glucosylceramidase